MVVNGLKKNKSLTKLVRDDIAVLPPKLLHKAITHLSLTEQPENDYYNFAVSTPE